MDNKFFRDSAFQEKARFVAGPEGVQDLKNNLISKIEDFKNRAGAEHNPDSSEYWDAFKGQLSALSTNEVFSLVSAPELKEEKVRDLLREEAQRRTRNAK